MGAYETPSLIYVDAGVSAGNPGAALGNEPVDINNLRINMGAYGKTTEASKTPVNFSLLPDLTNDGIVNQEDVTSQAMHWLESDTEQFGDLNRDGTVDFADLLLMTQDWLDTTSWY